MFVRPCWRPLSSQDSLRIIAQNPWSLLVSNGEDGPLATNLPLLIDRSSPANSAGQVVLVGHMARVNNHLRELADSATTVLAVFEGPWSYITASWYPNRDMPPTYYYTAVHCYGSIEMQEEDALDQALEDLTQRMESSYANGWSTNEIPRSEITRRFASIRGFRINVSRIEAKFKLGQDEPLRDALAVAEALEQHQGLESKELATLIRKQNNARSA